jgi:hypothetical protein
MLFSDKFLIGKSSRCNLIFMINRREQIGCGTFVLWSDLSGERALTIISQIMYSWRDMKCVNICGM